MEWSIGFEVVGLVISIILLFNLKSNRMLPMKSGNLFTNLIFISLLIILGNLAATGMDTYSTGSYTGLQIFLNTFYFAAVFLFFFSMHLFCGAIACEKSGRYFHTRIYSMILYLVMDALLVVNLFTGIIFRITPEGYERGSLYYYLLFPYMAIEMGIGVARIFLARKNMARRIRYSIYISTAIILFVSVYQIYLEPGRLMLSGGIALGLIIVYLAFIDSENDNEIKTGTYNTKGFRRYMTERILSGNPFRVYFLQIEGYDTFLSVFGRMKTDRMLWPIGRELIRKYRATFYLHSGLYAVVETNERRYDQLQRDIDIVIGKERYIDGERADMAFRTLVVTDSCGFADAQEMYTVVCDAIRARNYDKKPYEIVSAEDVTESEQKKRLGQAIYRDLKNDGVRVYYQPIYDNNCDQIHSAEALARIYDKELGLIFPDNFIPLFEQDGAILRFGKIIFENVCRFIRDNDMEELGLEYIEVNLSPIQCMQPSLPEDLIQIADRYGVDMKYINFEITETANLSADRLMHLMSTLIDRGASFSVDDFGTGYSNIIRVSNLPFRIIKIDKSILWDYFKTKDEMVPRIYEMMRIKGFTMVTEGVETEDMHYWLKNEAKCQYEQGYLYSKPIDEKSFIEYLRQHKKALA